MSDRTKVSIGFVLSIGTGEMEIQLSARAASTLSRFFNFQFALRSERTHLAMDHAARNFSYHRFNVQSGMGGIKLDEWKKSKSRNLTIEKITAITRKYLQLPLVQTEIRNIAKTLVENRQKRSRSSRWKSFVLGKTVAE